MGRTHIPYSKEQRDEVVVRLLPPSSESINQVSRETGISPPTLRKWKEEAERAANTQEKTPGVKLSTERIFQIVIETATFTELELGEYARKNGIYVEEIKRWSQNARLANGTGSYDINKYKQLEKKASEANKTIKLLNDTISNQNKEITEKNKVIAEQAAIILLQKKTFQLTV